MSNRRNRSRIQFQEDRPKAYDPNADNPYRERARIIQTQMEDQTPGQLDTRGSMHPYGHVSVDAQARISGARTVNEKAAYARNHNRVRAIDGLDEQAAIYDHNARVAEQQRTDQAYARQRQLQREAYAFESDQLAQEHGNDQFLADKKLAEQQARAEAAVQSTWLESQRAEANAAKQREFEREENTKDRQSRMAIAQVRNRLTKAQLAEAYVLDPESYEAEQAWKTYQSRTASSGTTGGVKLWSAPK